MFNVISLKNNYSTGYNEPIEFFTEMLLEASYFDLGLGYFSSSAIRSLSAGFAVFISSGGRMRVLINDVLVRVWKSSEQCPCISIRYLLKQFKKKC